MLLLDWRTFDCDNEGVSGGCPAELTVIVLNCPVTDFDFFILDPALSGVKVCMTG